MPTSVASIRIWADFHARDQDGRVFLTNVGSRKDLARYRAALRPGVRVVLYDSSQEAEGTLELREGSWLAEVDRATFKPTGNINLAREMGGWGFPPCLGYQSARFLV